MSRVFDWRERTVNFCAAERGASYSADAKGKPRIIVQCAVCGANAEKREAFKMIEYVHTAKIRAARRVEGEWHRREVRESSARLVFEVTSSCKQMKASSPSNAVK